MKFAKVAVAAAAVSLATAPAMAQPAIERSTAPAVEENSLDGSGAGAILVIFAILALVVGVGFAGGDSSPTSP